MKQETILKNLLKVGLLSIAICFGLLFYNIANYTFAKYQARYDSQTGIPYEISMHNRLNELECLTKNIYYEAGNEPFEGKVAVAQVTLNRVQSGSFPKSICGVVYQKNKFYEKVVCQFSWYCESPSKLRVVNRGVYNESKDVAEKVLFENYRLRSLEQAIYYHADYINPGWKKTRITKIGHHIFYRG
jgi:spore germination cell wall hydrolase CwlJ-like protein